jgi:hypothetical protein
MKYYAVSPSPFIQHDDENTAFEMQSAIAALGSEIGDAELSMDKFRELGAQMTVIQPATNPIFWRVAREQKLHAKSFIFAVDNFLKLFKKTAAMPAFPDGAEAILAKLFTDIPNVLDVRNSLHHIEDRAHGEGPGGRKIKPHPIDTSGIKVEPGSSLLLIGVNIYGNRVGNTAADGEFKEVEISEKTLTAMCAALQELINCFAWVKPNFFPDQNYPSL